MDVAACGASMLASLPSSSPDRDLRSVAVSTRPIPSLPSRRGLRLRPRGLQSFSGASVCKYDQRQLFPSRSKGWSIAASAEKADPAEYSDPIAPLQLESPAGQFLSQIMISHPHLLSAAVEQQLQQLKTDQDADLGKEQPSVAGSELVLYRRIAEVKENDRKRALEEILYTLILKRFVDADISMVPSIAHASSGDYQEQSQENKLEQLHSPEASEMIKNHLHLILGQRLEDSNSVAPISKLRIGQVYAASIMYGYFLRRVDQRFQLEKNMKSLPWGSDGEDYAIEPARDDESLESENSVQPQISSSSVPRRNPGEYGVGVKSSPLRSYVMSFDPETLQRYATVRSKEAFGIIEKHTEALFGRPEITLTPQGTIDSSKDELIKMSFSGLRRLILEAVTFGSFLWDVESYVDSRFRIDSTPIREVRRSREMGERFPSKPMSVYATIWDGSTWATSGGRYKVNYKHAPFVAKLTDLLLHGCAVDPLDHSSTCDKLDGRRFDGFSLTPEERLAMKRFRKEHITYSYCYDRDRYSRVPTECIVDSVEAKRIRNVEFLHRRRRHHRGRRSRSHDHHSSLVAKEEEA